MAISSFSGPVVTFPSVSIAGLTANTNPEEGPSLFNQGTGVLDPRPPFTYVPGQNFGYGTYGFLTAQSLVMDQAPTTAATNNIVAAAVPAGNVLTLVSASGAGITVGQSITRADTGATVTGLLVTDGAVAQVTYGQSATVKVWDPTTLVSRVLQITSAGNDTPVTFIVKGFDIYGFPITENIAGANIGVANGKKAFKYILSITYTGTPSGANVSVGTRDLIGLPWRADQFAHTEIAFNNTWITANTGFVAADTTSPATATTGDVRGTYALQTASDGTKRIQLYQTVMPANIKTANPGLFGVSQFANF